MTYTEGYAATEKTIDEFSTVPNLEGEEGEKALRLLRDLEDFGNALLPRIQDEQDEQDAKIDKAIRVLARSDLSTKSLLDDIQEARRIIRPNGQ